MDKEIELEEDCIRDEDATYVFPQLSMSEISVNYDIDEFEKGLKKSSYIAGLYTGLINCGMSIQDAVGYIFTELSKDLNIEISKITAGASIEVAKYVSIANEKNQI